jgi:DNA (cytosine-5)-methyltransferase 1
MASLKAIDFFCGAGGMSYGLAQAGIKVIAGIDVDPDCEKTYSFNNPGSVFIRRDIRSLSLAELSDKAGIKREDASVVFVGCSPCQYWTHINTDRDRSEHSKGLLRDFSRFVSHFRPGFIIIENVPGILKRKRESGLAEFLNFLTSTGYDVDYRITNVKDYGIPQIRKRFLLLGSCTGRKVVIPDGIHKPVTVWDTIGSHNGFPKIEAGAKDPTPFLHTSARLSEKNLRRIRLTPHDGGRSDSWRRIPDLQIKAYMGKDGCFRDVYGRMCWCRPAPTITTRFNSLSNGRFGHPEEDRAISLREGASLQTFPSTYVFIGSSESSIARQIGNAVPPALARELGRWLIGSWESAGEK